MKQYRQTEKWKAYSKKRNTQYYQEHRDELIEGKKQYHNEHRDVILERQRQYRKDHPDLLREQEKRKREKYKDEIRERKKRWQQGETYKAYQKRYQKENVEGIRMRRKQYYADRVEKLRERQRRYGKTAQGRMVDKAHQHNRRAQKKSYGGVYTAQQIREQLKRQRYRCYYAACGFAKFQKVNGRYIYHIEHTIPLSRASALPRNDISHIVLSCSACNLSKGTKLPHEWFDGGRLL